MKGFNEQFKKFKNNVGVTRPGSGAIQQSAPITTDKHDNSLVLLQAKLSEEIRQHMKEMSTAFTKQMKATTAWVEELKNVGALAESWGQHFSGQSGSQQLAASLKRLAEFNKMIANSMSSVAKFIDVGMLGPQRQFVKSDIKGARQVKKKYDRAKHELLSSEEQVDSLQKAGKPTGEAESRVNIAMSTFREISDEALTAITHTNETADCNSIELNYSYLETHRSMFIKGDTWLNDVEVQFEELKGYVTSQKAELARSAPSTPESYGQRRVFGVSIEELASREGGGWASTTVPAPINELISALHGTLATDGLFRMSPEQSVLERPRVAIDRGDRIDFTSLDPHVLTGLFKKYLRSMPQPLLGRYYQQWIVVPSLEEPERTNVCQKLLCDLPPVNLALLSAIAQLCTAINAESASNRMNFSNLAIVFAPCILFDMAPASPTAAAAVDPQAAKLEMVNSQKIIEYLISSSIVQSCAAMPSRPRSSPRPGTPGSPMFTQSAPTPSTSGSNLSYSASTSTSAFSSSSSSSGSSPVYSSPITSSTPPGMMNLDAPNELSPRGIRPTPPTRPAHMLDPPPPRGRPPAGTPPRPGHPHPLPSTPPHPTPPSQPLPTPRSPSSAPRRGIPIAVARQIVGRGHT